MRPLRSLHRDRRGVAAVEFGIIATTFGLLIMGLSDLCYQAYVQALLTGAIQKAGRDSTIQGSANRTSQIDAKVMQSVWTIAKAATYASTRKSYAQFGHIAPEPFTDNNNNNQYDKTVDCFTDVNGNGTWDADPGTTGQGGAGDVVLYTIKVTYPRLFPMAGLAGLPQNVTLSASTILKNQPYAAQNAYPVKQVCP